MGKRFDINEVEPERDPTPVPSSVYRLRAEVLPAGVVNVLRLAKNGRTEMLELKCRIVGGEHDGSLVYDYITLRFDDTHYDNPELDITPQQARKYETAVELGYRRLRALIDSAHALDPKDKSDAAREIR